MHQLRPYQQDVFNDIVHHFKTSNENVIVDLSVAFGKTLLIAHLAKHVINKGGQVLSMAHTQELLSGAAETFGKNECSIYCASLGRKEINKKMIYASPQSLVKRLNNLQKIDLLMIDEVQFLSDRNENTVYMKIVNHILKQNKKCRVLGLSGSPFRLERGKTALMVGTKRLFKKIIATVYIKDLLKLGYLTKPITPHTQTESYDFSDLKMKMGKYQDKDLNEVTKNERLTKTIIRDCVNLCKDRKKVLIFASTLQHAKEIQGYLHEFGETCGYMDGKLNKTDRAMEIKLFNCGRHKYLVNKDLLGTGYDEPEIDAVILLRPSESRSLIIQFLGRSLRLHESKQDALILDYAGNFDSLEDLLSNESIKSISHRDKESSDEVIQCPECGCLNGENVHKCSNCGFYFISKTCEKCDTQQAISNRYCINCEAELIDPNIPLTISASGQERFVARVINTSLSSHRKNVICLRLDFLTDDKLNNYPNVSQFMAQSSGHLKHWIKKHYKKTTDPVMDTMMIDTYTNSVQRILAASDRFDMPEIIEYKKVGKYFNLV